MTQVFHWSRFFYFALRAVVVCGCVMGIWESCQFVRSERLYDRRTPDAIRAAIVIEPDCWYCYIALAANDDQHAIQDLRASLRYNPYDSQVLIDLGLRYEAEGDLRQAEANLLQAYAIDRAYPPRWSLANFYFRRDNRPAVWMWARRAAEMPSAELDQLGALFALCWRVSPNPQTIEAKVVVDDPDVLRQYSSFLMGKNLPAAAVHPALRFFSTGSGQPNYMSEGDLAWIANLLDQLIAAGGGADASAANDLWRGLVRQHRIVAETSVPNNPLFARDPLTLKFDWNLAASAGLHSWPGPSGLRAEFTGDEPEDCAIAEQIIALPPGKYRLVSFYRTENIPANTGIRWEIADVKTGAVLASSPDLSSNSPAQISQKFSLTPDAPFQQLRLTYKREPGTVRIVGTLVVTSIEIQPAT